VPRAKENLTPAWSPTDVFRLTRRTSPIPTSAIHTIINRDERQENLMLYGDRWRLTNARRLGILRIGRTEQRQGDDEGGDNGGKHAVCMVTKDMLG